MTDETDNTQNHSSFAVALNPEFNDKGEWNGSVFAHIEEDVYDDLSDDELLQIRTVCGMMAACLPLLEQDPDFLEYVKEYFYANYQKMIDDIVDDCDLNKPNFTKDGNVITLNFNTKTHGSA
jgi:hypothetical protein